MSRRPRLHAPELSPALGTRGDAVALSPTASAHLAQVLRARRGDEVSVFDGRGNEYLAHVEEPNKQSCGLRLTQLLRSEPPPTRRLHLLQAAIKSGLEGVVQQATELVATDITMFHAERSAPGTSLRPDRAVRIAIGAAEQSGRLFLPAITTAPSFAATLKQASAGERFIALPDAQPLAPDSEQHDGVIAIGPEGGFTSTEVEHALEAGFHPLGLGPLTLRSATAAPAAIAAWQQAHRWRGMNT